LGRRKELSKKRNSFNCGFLSKTKGEEKKGKGKEKI